MFNRKIINYDNEYKNRSVQEIEAEFMALIEEHREIYQKIYKYLIYSTEVDSLLFKLSIKAEKNKFQAEHLFYFCISPLLEVNPELAEIENIERLRSYGELFIDLSVKVLKNKFDPGYLFQYAIFPLLEVNPELIENIGNLRSYGELFVELGGKGTENEVNPGYLFQDGTILLLRVKPELAEVENIERLRSYGELFLELGIKAVKNKVGLEKLFPARINPLLKTSSWIIGKLDQLIILLEKFKKKTPIIYKNLLTLLEAGTLDENNFDGFVKKLLGLDDVNKVLELLLSDKGPVSSSSTEPSGSGQVDTGQGVKNV